jgi:hypothetical protein
MPPIVPMSGARQVEGTSPDLPPLFHATTRRDAPSAATDTLDMKHAAMATLAAWSIARGTGL